MHDKNRRYSFTSGEKEEVSAVIRNYLESFSVVVFAFVHGSFTDENLSFGDVDIAVYFDDCLSEDEVLDICLEMSAHLSAMVHLPVDAHALNDSGVGFRYEVTKGKLLHTKDEELSFDFMEQTWAEYFDMRAMLEENLKDLLYSG